ncbi:MAG: DUF4153 domain-containing protein [Bacteroidota bacterium]
MIPKYYRFLMVVLLTIIYNAFFWQKELGINVMVFSILMIGSLLALNPSARSSRNVWITAFGTILTGLMVVYHNSPFSKVVHIFSLILFAGFVHQPSMRSVILALLGILRSYYHILRDGFYNISHSLSQRKTIGNIWDVFRASFLPLSIIIAFLTVFAFANPRFDSLMNNLILLFSSLFQGLNPSRLFFFLLGGLLILGLIYSPKESVESEFSSEFLSSSRPFDPNTARKTYFTWSLILLIANILLFLYLIIEADWIWINFEVPEDLSLRAIAFKGLFLVIFIILPSISIFMYQLYRHKHLIRLKGRLRKLSIIWLVQICLLLFSVQVRIYRYIDYAGISYKRIFVLLTLTFVLIGVCVLLIMMLKREGYYFFVRTSSWAAYTLIVVLTLFSWDNSIARFNLDLSNRRPIEGMYLTKLEDHVLPILLENTHLALKDSEATVKYLNALEQKMLNFRKEYHTSSWLSWNFADHRTHMFLESQGYKAIQDAIQVRKTHPKSWEDQQTTDNEAFSTLR